MSALTLLALCNIKETDNWESAQKISLGVTKGIMTFMQENYKRNYAPNTRETVRRQVLHQFVQAGIADYNPDIPDLPVNSPKAHYAISKSVLTTIKTFGTKKWTNSVDKFKKEIGELKKVYRKSREIEKIPIKVSKNKTLLLSPGKHNEVQASIIEQFAPRFAKGSQLLYLGDTEKKDLFMEKTILQKKGIPINKHSKLPDVILYDKDKNWLFLVEAVTSHGSISPKRIVELEELLKKCSAGKVYVTAFPNFSEFKKHSKEIAWETEVWIMDMPDHMIHYDGDKFMGPR